MITLIRIVVILLIIIVIVIGIVFGLTVKCIYNQSWVTTLTVSMVLRFRIKKKKIKNHFDNDSTGDEKINSKQIGHLICAGNR